MKFTKRGIPLFLALLLLCTCFSGCGSSETLLEKNGWTEILPALSGAVSIEANVGYVSNLLPEPIAYFTISKAHQETLLQEMAKIDVRQFEKKDSPGFDCTYLCDLRIKGEKGTYNFQLSNETGGSVVQVFNQETRTTEYYVGPADSISSDVFSALQSEIFAEDGDDAYPTSVSALDGSVQKAPLYKKSAAVLATIFDGVAATSEPVGTPPAYVLEADIRGVAYQYDPNSGGFSRTESDETVHYQLTDDFMQQQCTFLLQGAIERSFGAHADFPAARDSEKDERQAALQSSQNLQAIVVFYS
ncbi:MAG: hypothetical protein VB055_03965 [Oscillospiraceae bacterium]|nr:hypothetical protein [Oscillospiraceae bacterium]